MNILIVDDEPMIREWFQMTVERTGGDYRIAGEASNGEDALAFCRTHPVDLVVTDIKMPGMNGIDLIKALKEELPRIRSVVFSSYSEFQFAAEALKFGASEYILKAEITLSGLEEILRKIKKDIELDQRAASEINALRYSLNESQVTLRNAYFRELLEGGREAAIGFADKMERLHIGLSEKHLTLLAVGIVQGEKPLRIQEEGLLQNAVINILDETMQHELGNGCSFLYKPGLYIMLCNSVHTGLKSQRESLLVLASRASEHLKRFVCADAVIGISHMYSKLSYLPEQLSEALAAADRHLFYGDPGIAWYEEKSSTGSSAYNNVSSGWTSMFQGYMDNGLTAKAGSLLATIMDELGTGKLLSAKQARSLVLELIYIAVNRGRAVGVPMEQLETLYIDAHVEVQRYATFKELSGWASSTFHQIMDRISAQRPQYVEAVERACEYIAQRYAEDLMLQDIADHVHLSRTYISELFKKETGMNYNEYLMQVRMEKAKELLKRQTLKVADAAALVGYSNTSYFIKLFKNYTGLSPSEYMERQRNI
ncbi:helix-turn-helix domain-containing protein [Paenibacillus glycanilyticus]|uniref:DNA-binding response regulator n=1 Tax=Paenibacillus glycanilyticus TaxID=126569 RepID=A0ABQ6GB84_9BACL|nr:helix-turn-helix domain-containing protein [Paenibacillus glycanilyticus]GLX67770.1 DNA-binding response regulator [Paenibacillus glycanilyticus]